MKWLKFAAILFGATSKALPQLYEVDEKGVPGYKRPQVAAAASTAVLEAASSALGAPGVGSAIGVVLTYIASAVKIR